MNVEKLRKLFDLTGRTAIITGGTRGIGFALARGYLAAGANVVVTGRPEDRCRAAQSQLEVHTSGRVAAIAAHMGDLDRVKHLVQQPLSTFSGIDIVVNNAATSLLQQFGEITPEAWHKSLSVKRDRPAVLGPGGAAPPDGERTRGGTQPDLSGGVHVRGTDAALRGR